MSIDTSINLDYLLPELRLYIGDTNSSAYRYTDGWLRVALVTSVKSLQRWWRTRYLVDTDNNVYRNTNSTFSTEEPEVLEQADERPVLLMASILVKSGVLQENSWSVGSWRDAEYAVSNIEGGKMKDASLARDWNELLMYLKPPSKRLSAGSRVTFDFGSDETK